MPDPSATTLAAMVTPVNNMAASSIQNAIRRTYTLQEKYLQIDVIIGALFEQGVISFELMMQIQSEQVPLKKRRLLLNHLYKEKKRAIILTYCDILKKSASSCECVVPSHALIASRVRKLLLDDAAGDGCVEWERWEQELLQFLLFIDPSASSKYAVAIPFSTSRHPPRAHPVGILTSKIHHIMTNVVLNLNRRKAELAVDLVMEKDYPIDLIIAILQVGCNDSEEYIPKLESKGLALCQREECQNPVILKFRLHAHLAWCYFTVDSEKCREHVEAALCLQHLIHHDVLFSALMLIHAASLAYDALQSGTLSPEVEQSILDTAIPAALHHGNRNTVNFGSNSFLECSRSCILCIYLVLAEYHRRKGNRCEMTSRMMSMKRLAQKCDYQYILSLSGDTQTSWFSKLSQLWKMPATLEDLLECNDPSKLLRCINVEDSSEVKELREVEKLSEFKESSEVNLTQYVSTADSTKLNFWHQCFSKWVLHSRIALGFFFRFFRMLVFFFVALFVHIL